MADLAGTKDPVPRIPYQGTCLIPDLVISRGDQSVVLNVTITTDCPDTPNTAHDRKVTKHAVKEVKDFVQNITGNRPHHLTACAINWKGTFTPNSARDLIQLGLNKKCPTLLSICGVEQSTNIHQTFMKSTSRARSIRHRR